MPKIRIKPALDKLYKNEIQGLVLSLAEKTKTIAVVTGTIDCPNCFYDRVKKASSGTYNGVGAKPFKGKTCPVCKGKGRLKNDSEKKVRARIRFGDTPEHGDTPLPQGMLAEGQIEIKVIDKDYQTLVDATYFKVDGVRYTKRGRVKRRGLLSNAVAISVARRDDS